MLQVDSQMDHLAVTKYKLALIDDVLPGKEKELESINKELQTVKVMKDA
jgi:hypothetical protein